MKQIIEVNGKLYIEAIPVLKNNDFKPEIVLFLMKNIVCCLYWL